MRVHPTWMLLRSASALSSSSSTSTPNNAVKRIAVIGGGASGIFSAISAAERFAASQKKKHDNNNNNNNNKELLSANNNLLQVVVLEATSKTLTKVAISGGGRCNVLHDTSKSTSELLNGYPRGKKELTGLLSSRFTPLQAQEWFRKHGVQLKTEPDGRMFPVTDSSQTVIDALLNAAAMDDIVDIRTRQKVLRVELYPSSEDAPHNNNNNNNNDDDKSIPKFKFKLSTQKKDSKQDKSAVQEEWFDSIILATGSAPVGYQLAQSILEQAKDKIDHQSFVSPVPSLFTLNTKLDIKEEGSLLYGLAGVSVPKAHVRYKPEESTKHNDDDDSSSSGTGGKKKKRGGKKPAHLQQEGPLLVTHHGVSGPAVLRLSAFGARDFHEANYKGALFVHWAPDLGTVDDITTELWKMTQTNPKRQVVTGCPLSVKTTVKDSSSTSSSSPADQTSNNHHDDEHQGFTEKTTAAIPKRLWASLVTNGCDIAPTTTWAEVNKKSVRKLATQIAECQLQVTGKGTFKEEFVTAGGVALKEIDMRTMMSKSCDGFFFCGEVINVDGVTGGFNFMNCWGTGFVAGTSAVDYCFGGGAFESSDTAAAANNNQKASSKATAA